jgi:hypothetical protein
MNCNYVPFKVPLDLLKRTSEEARLGEDEEETSGETVGADKLACAL